MHDFVEVQVRDCMSRSHVVIGCHATLEEAETLFRRHDFNLLPVIDNLRLVGVLTKTDLLKALCLARGSGIPPYFEITNQEVQAFMTRDPLAVPPDAPLMRVVEQMVSTHHRAFPVVDGDRLVGIVSREDVLRALRDAAGGKAPRA